MDFTDVALTALKVVSPVLVAALTWAAAKLAGLIRSKVESEYLRGVHRFETTLPDASNRVWFRLLTGADERKLPQLRRNAGDQLLSAMLAFRVLEVDGVEARDKKKFTENP